MAANAAEDSGDKGTLEQVLDLLFAHRMKWVQECLRDRGLAFSGDKEQLRSRTTSYIDAGKLAVEDLIELLDEVDGWGNQHIYLYILNDQLLTKLAVEANVREALRRRRCAKLLNGRLPLLLPDEITLSAVHWSTARLRFVWIEKRTWRDRLEDEDREDGDLEFDAYRRKESRGIVAFDCDLVAGSGHLMIQRLPSGNDYLEQKRRFEKELGHFLDIAQLEEFRVSPGIRRIDESKDIRKRSTGLQTRQGSRITFTSKSTKEDAYGDPIVRKARDAVGHDAAGRLGNFYWPNGQKEAREIHVKLYAQDQRVGIFGECSEEEVRHVLTEVRRHCT